MPPRKLTRTPVSFPPLSIVWRTSLLPQLTLGGHRTLGVRRPPNHLVDKFGAACFHCGRPGHWRADFPSTKGFVKPNPCQVRAKTLEERPPLASGSRYQRERVSQVQFVEHHAADKVLIDSDSNSSITITQMETLKIPVKGGLVVIIVRNHLVTTTFHNDCWWMNVTVGEETNESAAETSSPPLIAMNLLSFPAKSKLSCRKWHERSGNASNKVVRSFLKQNVPSFELKSWKPLYCKVKEHPPAGKGARGCFDGSTARSPSLLHHGSVQQGSTRLPICINHTRPCLDVQHHLSAEIKIRCADCNTGCNCTPDCSTGNQPKGITDQKCQGVCLCVPHHGTLKARYQSSPVASLFATREWQGEASQLHAGCHGKSGMPDCFWQFAYASACYLHNHLPNKRCQNSTPHQVLYRRPPLIVTLYPFGERAIVHVPAVHQPNKLAERGIECQLLKPLLASGSWLLWDPESNRMIHSASAVFPHFQTACLDKGSLRHVLNMMSLGQVPTELYFECEEKAINSLLLAKDILVPENLKQALLNENGNIKKFKARLVARGNRQRPGVDCTETYAPTASLMSLRLLLATACPQRWKACSFNVSGAYLYSPVEETVLMKPPTHFILSLEGKVLHLQKALYGMKQAGCCWWLHLSGIVEGLGFTLCKVGLSLYVFRKDKAIIVIWIHIDNGMIASNSPAHIKEFRKALCEKFEIKWSNTMRQIVGLECTIGEDEVTLLQTRLTNDIINTYPRKIFQHDSPLPPISKASPDEQGDVMEATPFRSVIGSLAYLVSGSWPDLAFAINYLDRHSMAPTETHWAMLDHLVGYLLKNRGHGITLRRGDCSLNLWSDAGWGGELERSQSGFMLKLGNAPILWGLKQQTVVALSTCASEYIALSDLRQHLVQAINQLTQLAQNFKKTIFCDNQAAVQVSINNFSCKRMRYLDCAFFFVNDVILKHGAVVKWVTTQEMQADALTKRLLGQSLTQAL
ncbi:hypothetical protein O181_017715 [Austropuccinia psidii MF-1]|uniref:Reverse transcriptase Ty1/copia-type domain-containing protein n=1 Tax=Austropuccinia psidii MF-1 TaxID=1389203 RepID=A0A9Q3GTA9_9BASI|nr:hypothetical protein [Austropuccinia psidii MF-1]